MTFFTFANEELKIDISKSIFWVSRNMYFAQKEGVQKEGRFGKRKIFTRKEPLII